MRLKFRRRKSVVVAQIVVQVCGDRSGFEVRVMAEPDLDSKTTAAMLRRGATEVERQASGAGGSL